MKAATRLVILGLLFAGVVAVRYRSHRPTTLKIRTAADLGDLRAINELLDANPASVNERDSIGFTPLTWAAISNEGPAAELLIARGADVNSVADDGDTPLHLAAIAGHDAVAKILVAHGANVKAHNKSGGKTPMCEAAFFGRASTVEILATADPSSVDEPEVEINGSSRSLRTPLHFAVVNNTSLPDGNLEVISILLRHNAKIDARDSTGCTPLQAAAGAGNIAAVKALLGAGAPVNSLDQLGGTALHAAAGAFGLASFTGVSDVRDSTQLEIVEQLLAHGADPTIKAASGLTPADCAARFRLSQTAKALREAADRAIAGRRPKA